MHQYKPYVRTPVDPLKVKELSSCEIVVAFFDSLGKEMIPDSVIWTLTDHTGAHVINNRLRTPITPDRVVTITLSGDDLALPSKQFPWRLLTIEATYTSSAGMALPLTEQFKFQIDPIEFLPFDSMEGALPQNGS